MDHLSENFKKELNRIGEDKNVVGILITWEGDGHSDGYSVNVESKKIVPFNDLIGAITMGKQLVMKEYFHHADSEED